jgi:hypothetical protein
MAEDQHYRRKNLEFQQFLATRPAHEPWWQHQHILTQAAATLYSMARPDLQGDQFTGLPAQNLPVRKPSHTEMVHVQSQPPSPLIVYLNPGPPWTGFSNSGQLLAQQSGVVQRGLQKLVSTGPPSLDSLVRDSVYDQIKSGRTPSQIVIPPPSHMLADFANSAGMYAAPAQHTQQMPGPTAHVYTPPQPIQNPPQPVQQHTQRMSLRQTSAPSLLPSQLMPSEQAPPFITPTKRKSPPSLPTLARASGITKPVPQTPRTPATPRMSVPDHTTWATLTKAQKVAKILEHDRGQKAGNPSMITPLDQYFAEHKEDVDRVLTDKAKRGRPKKRRDDGTASRSPPPTFSILAPPMPQGSSFTGSTPPKRKDFTEIAFKVKGYTNNSTSAYTPLLNQHEARHQREETVPASYGAQSFVNHPRFSNIVGGFPAPRFHGLPEVPSVPSQGEKRAGEIG